MAELESFDRLPDNVSAEKQLKRQEKKFAKYQRVTLLLLYAGYGVLFMTAFNGIIVILPAMQGDDSITFENSTAGRLLAIGNIAYLLGKFMMGPVTDRVGGRGIMLLSQFVPALFVLGFSFSSNFWLWAGCWICIRFAMSSCWLAINKLVFNWYRSDQFGKVLGIVATASKAGLFTSGIVLGTFLNILGDDHWRLALMGSAAILAGGGVLQFLLLRENPPASPYKYASKSSKGGGGVATGADSDTEEEEGGVGEGELPQRDMERVELLGRGDGEGGGGVGGGGEAPGQRLLHHIQGVTSEDYRKAADNPLQLTESGEFVLDEEDEEDWGSASSSVRQRTLEGVGRAGAGAGHYDEVDFSTTPIDHHDHSISAPAPPLTSTLIRFAKSKRFWTCTIGCALLTFLNELEASTPLYLKTVFEVTSGQAGAMAVVYPVGSAISILASGYFLDKASKRKGYALLLTTMTIGTIASAVLMIMTYLIHTGAIELSSLEDGKGADGGADEGDLVVFSLISPLQIALACIFFMSVGIAPTFHLIPSLFALKFGGKHGTALLIGIIIGTGYGFATVYELILSKLTEKGTLGWSYMFGIMFGVFIISLAFMIFFYWFDYRAYKREKKKLQLAKLS